MCAAMHVHGQKKTVDASAFSLPSRGPSAQLPPPSHHRYASKDELTYHSVWERLRRPGFVIPPSICNHTPIAAAGVPTASFAGSLMATATTWEVYDMNMAGCTLCGALHLCRDGSCPVEKNEEGYDICTVTGMCVKMLSFSNEEFLDTVCISSELSSSSHSLGVVAWDEEDGDSEVRYGSRDARNDAGYHASSCRMDGDDSCVGTPLEPHGQQVVRKRSSAQQHSGPGCSGRAMHPSAKRACLGFHCGSDAHIECSRQQHGHSSSSGSTSSPKVPVLSRAEQQQRQHLMMLRQKMEGSSRCSVNKKNRYRSWVYHRVMHHRNHPYHQHHHHTCHSHARHLSGQVLASPMPAVPGCVPAPSYAAAANPPRNSTMDDAGRVEALIQMCVWDVLCSAKWKRSMQLEEAKMISKKKSLFLKCIKILKLRGEKESMGLAPCASDGGRQKTPQCAAGTSNVLVSVPEAACMVACMMGSVRQPRVNASQEERDAVCTWCVDAIYRHICLVNSMCKGVVTEAKLRTTVVGLLYMIRQGIIVHELVVLPRLQCLETLLPLENHLEPFFGVKAKCITETENVVKIILRSVTKQQLIDAGVSRIACRL